MVEGMGVEKMAERKKQMGPASLPTPLSPTRGRLVLGVPPASRSFTLSKTRLASDVSRRSRSVLHSAPEGASFRHARRQIPRLASSPALAPASGRRLSARFTPPLSRGFARALRSLSSEAETVRLSGSRSQTVAFGLTLLLPQSRSKLAVLHVDDFTLLSNDPSRPSVDTGLDLRLNLRHDVSRQARGQLPTRSLVHKTLLFQGLAALRFSALCPEDLLKLRPNPRIGKGGKSDFSTFPRIICGQRWTTQRFVAFTSLTPEPKRGSRISGGCVREHPLCENCATQL